MLVWACRSRYMHAQSPGRCASWMCVCVCTRRVRYCSGRSRHDLYVAGIAAACSWGHRGSSSLQRCMSAATSPAPGVSPKYVLEHFGVSSHVSCKETVALHTGDSPDHSHNTSLCAARRAREGEIDVHLRTSSVSNLCPDPHGIALRRAPEPMWDRPGNFGECGQGSRWKPPPLTPSGGKGDRA